MGWKHQLVEAKQGYCIYRVRVKRGDRKKRVVGKLNHESWQEPWRSMLHKKKVPKPQEKGVDFGFFIIQNGSLRALFF